MESNNKKRLLYLIEILKTKTDMDHKLSLNEITSLLNDKGVTISNRKTLYDDFKILSEFGYEAEYDHGYYLSEAPFSLSEMKIIMDSLNSLKNLDNQFLSRLNDKLYSFMSDYEIKTLKELEYKNTHSDKKFINRLEDTLLSIQRNTNLIIKRSNREEEEISPLFLYRNNDFYYLYYHYVGNESIYHTRFDNIVSMKLTDHLNDINISKAKIIKNIQESTNSYTTRNIEEVKFEIIQDSDYLRSRIKDDFSNVIFTKNGFSIKVSISDVFFSKLTSYSDQIKISNPKIADQYIQFLKKIITRNK